jgi:hypothetical protein
LDGDIVENIKKGDLHRVPEVRIVPELDVISSGIEHGCPEKIPIGETDVDGAEGG